MITLPDSGRLVTARPPDIFDLALRGDIPGPITAGVRRLLLSTMIANGMATQAEIDAYNAPLDMDANKQTIRFLIEEGTSDPKLIADLDRALELKAQGVAVDLQHRYSQRDLLFVYDAVLGRGGRLYAAIFPDTDAEPASDIVAVVSADADDAPATESVSEYTEDRELAGVSA